MTFPPVAEALPFPRMIALAFGGGITVLFVLILWTNRSAAPPAPPKDLTPEQRARIARRQKERSGPK